MTDRPSPHPSLSDCRCSIDGAASVPAVRQIFGSVSLARKTGQIVGRGRHRWLVRVFLGRDRETRRRRYLSRTVHSAVR